MQQLAQISSLKFKRTWYFIKYLLPVILVGSVGSTITFLNSLCNGNTRWIFLFVLFLFLFIKKKLIRFIDGPFAFLLFVYLAWGLFTSFWSEIPLLSFMKSGISVLVILTLITATIELTSVNPWFNALNYLWLLMCVVLLAGFLGKYADPHQTSGAINQNTIIYQGLVRGSNMFGELLAMIFPFLLWKTYFSKPAIIRLIYFVLMLGCIFFLISSMSRASMLAVLTIFLLFVFSLTINKKLSFFIILLLVATMLPIANQNTFINLTSQFNKYLYKFDNKDIFLSRRNYWKISAEGAKEGGWFGLGYGISFGKMNFDLSNGLKSSFYGREKSNSQLAIIEETGMVGFILYLVLVGFLLNKLIVLYFKENDQNKKVLIGIITGTFLGMLIQSIFEAWWNSPGSPESIYFWLLIGVIRGLEMFFNKQRLEHENYRIKT